jgi:hypothetical protein
MGDSSFRRREVHALMTAVLLRMPWSHAFELDLAVLLAGESLATTGLVGRILYRTDLADVSVVE